MAKLERVTGKVFAGSASLTNLGVFGSAKAGTPTNPTGSGTEAQIQAPAAYDQGWTSAVVTSRNFPPIEEVNGVLRTISYQNCYLLQEGVPEYDINTLYSNTSIVKNISGNELSFYISLVDNNIGNALTDTDYWVKAVFSGAANTSLSNLNATGQAVIDGKANTDLTNITSAATKQFDGQWVNTNNVAVSTSKSSGSQTISLSSYLPNDGYNYEALITVHFDDGGSSYKYATIKSSVITSAFVCAEVGDYSDYCINTFILPVGTNRQITWYKSDNIARDAYVRLQGYRRIGTNS